MPLATSCTSLVERLLRYKLSRIRVDKIPTDLEPRRDLDLTFP
ncbi:MAG: hypothetical protein RL091_1746 [Verrucomicrobiota bacterium]|jgi:hypothetical protein